MICFPLQGATVADAPTTLMAYMLSDFYRPGVQLDFPRGGELISSDLPGSPLVSVGVQLDFPRGLSLNRVVVGFVVDEPWERNTRAHHGASLFPQARRPSSTLSCVD
jgi:hypothetical protein